MLPRTLLLLLVGALAAAVAADSKHGNRKRAAFLKGEAVLAAGYHCRQSCCMAVLNEAQVQVGGDLKAPL